MQCSTRFRGFGQQVQRAGQKTPRLPRAPAPAWSSPRICQIVVELRDAPCRELAFTSPTRDHGVCHMRSDVDLDNSQSGLQTWWIDPSSSLQKFFAFLFAECPLRAYNGR